MSPITPNFPLPLAGEFVDNSRTFMLLSPFQYVDPAFGWAIEVPEGFVTDFNSVPRALWYFFAPWEYPEAGVVHDYLYRYEDDVTRAQADAVHRRILELLGCPWWKRHGAHSALRLFGWAPWNRYRQGE